jgi:hypothetical protein
MAASPPDHNELHIVIVEPFAMMRSKSKLRDNHRR